MVRIVQRDSQRAPQSSAAASLRDYDEEDNYKIFPEEVPEGMSYEWKRLEIYGKEDRAYQSKLRQFGRWSPVPADRHPRFNMAGEQAIVIDGMMLMERPTELSEERRRRDRVKSSSQFQDKMAAIGNAMPNKLKVNTLQKTVEIPE